jgi:hypothetical protein
MFKFFNRVKPQTEIKVHQPLTQSERIFNALKASGEAGVTNYQLTGIALRYGARLLELRKDGHKILSVHVKGSMWRFILVP